MFEVAVIVFLIAQFCVTFLLLGVLQKVHEALMWIKRAYQIDRLSNALNGKSFWESKEM